jgi:hypothetical protein
MQVPKALGVALVGELALIRELMLPLNTRDAAQIEDETGMRTGYRMMAT